MSEIETSVASTETATATEAPAKRKRAPRGALTAGDIQNAYRLSRGNMEMVHTAMEGHEPEVVQKALAALSKVNPDLAQELGFAVIPKDSVAVDFRKGVFIHLADLGVEKGDVIKVTREGKTVTLTLP